MRRYHHIGIPTTEAKSGETHVKRLKLFVVSHAPIELLEFTDPNHPARRHQ